MRLVVPAAFLVFFLVLLFVFQGALLPFVLGLFVAYILAPPVRWMHNRLGLPRGISVLVLFALIFGGLGMFGYYVLPQLGSELAVLPSAATKYFREFQHDLKNKWIPAINEQLERYLPEEPEIVEIDTAAPERPVVYIYDPARAAYLPALQPVTPPGRTPLTVPTPATALPLPPPATAWPLEPIPHSGEAPGPPLGVGTASGTGPGTGSAGTGSAPATATAALAGTAVATATAAGTGTAAAAPMGTGTAVAAPMGTVTAVAAPMGTVTAAAAPMGTGTAAAAPMGTVTAAAGGTAAATAAAVAALAATAGALAGGPGIASAPTTASGAPAMGAGTGIDGTPGPPPGAIPAPPSLFTLHPAVGGGYVVAADEVALRIEDIGDGRYLITPLASEERRPARGPDYIMDAFEDALAGVPAGIGELIGEGVALVQSIVASTIALFVKLILTFMVAGFLLVDIDRVFAFFQSLLPIRLHADFLVVVLRLDRGLSGVIRGQLLICLINGVLSGLGFWLLGLKFWLVLAIIAGVLSLIPIFGTIISSIPAVGLGLTQGWLIGALVLAWILGIHFVEANFLNPKIIGSQARIHPVLVVLALVVGQAAAGLAGALLAVPTFSVVQTVFLYIRNKAAAEPSKDQVAGTAPEEPTATGERSDS